jgi:hypothetical protein
MKESSDGYHCKTAATRLQGISRDAVKSSVYLCKNAKSGCTYTRSFRGSSGGIHNHQERSKFTTSGEATRKPRNHIPYTYSGCKSLLTGQSNLLTHLKEMHTFQKHALSVKLGRYTSSARPNGTNTNAMYVQRNFQLPAACQQCLESSKDEDLKQHIVGDDGEDNE